MKGYLALLMTVLLLAGCAAAPAPPSSSVAPLSQEAMDFDSASVNDSTSNGQPSPATTLTFPPAWEIVTLENQMAMPSGGRCAIGEPDSPNRRVYDGTQMDSIIRYYLDEALPQLGAVGAPSAGTDPGAWAWSGSYQNGKPLIINLTQQPVGYYIEITYDHGSTQPIPNPQKADPERERYWEIANRIVFNLAYDWAEPTDIRLEALSSHYLVNELIPAGTNATDATPESVPEAVYEDYMKHYFGLSSQHLRTADYYNAVNHCYDIYGGIGSGPRWSLISINGRKTETLELTCRLYDMTDYAAPMRDCTFTIRQDGDSYRYLSCKSIQLES